MEFVKLKKVDTEVSPILDLIMALECSGLVAQRVGAWARWKQKAHDLERSRQACLRALHSHFACALEQTQLPQGFKR